MPKAAGLVAASFLGAAYASNAESNQKQRWKGYVTAAVLAVAIVPYTLLLMKPTNDLLHSAAAGTGNGSVDVSSLIDKWAALNLGRSLLPLSSAVVGMLTFLGHI
jgi:hypothetical protein